MDTTGYTPDEPIAAIATALAPGALGIVRCSGKGSIELLSNVFSRPEALRKAGGNSLVYGWLQESAGCAPQKEQRTESPRRIDEVMVGVYRSPKSFTGEDMVEISCHGGVAVVNAVYHLLLANGFRPAERGEFTFRAYINGKTDLTRAEAVREIIDSKTDMSRSRAAGRLAGSVYEAIDGIKKRIVDTLASIEVEIEYPEDEETISDTFNPQELALAARDLEDLAGSWKSEKIYQDGARVVLCGRTNAGKSSLFNALLKEDRAIVSDIEGTTRDWIESWVDFNGIPARLFDTAGLRETDDVIEQRGVERTRDLTQDADLILYLIDASAGVTDDDRAFFQEQAQMQKAGGQHDVPLFLVWNKADKLADASQLSFPEAAACATGTIMLSAKKGTGIDALCDAVSTALQRGAATTRTQAGLGSERQKTAVEEALSCVRHALALTKDFTLDAAVQDLEDALDALGAVTGDVTPEDVLDSVFSHFCVGK